MRNNTTGNYNTSTGFEALVNNTTGSENVAVGHMALTNNQTGDKNTALGYQALWACKGWDNTAAGHYALLSNTTGFDNAAMGVNALGSNTTGNGNTAIGKNSMAWLTIGDNNTAIGFDSNIANGISNSTAIGYQATVNSSNKIVIGNASVTTIGSYGTWTNYSDRRLKENIVYSGNLGLNFITRLKPASYNYIKDTNKHRRDGLIAQDVQQVLKELGIEFSGLIIDNDADKTQNLAYAEFVIPLINAVNELNAKNLQLQEENQDFRQSLLEVKSEIARLKQTIQSK